MNKLTDWLQKPKLDCTMDNQRYQLLRLNDQKYYELSEQSLCIGQDIMYLIGLEQYFREKNESLNLAQIYVILTIIAGESSQCYDDWKGSFCFPFALKIEKNNRILDNYLLILSDWRGNLEFRFQRLVTENEINQGLKREVIRKPFEDEFSRKEINNLISYLYIYFIRYFQLIKDRIWPNFFKCIDSNIILYGYQYGQFWQTQYQDCDEYEAKVRELKSQNIKQTISLPTSINGEEKIIEIGIETGEKKLINRLIKRRFGDISLEIEQRINQLSVDQVELLGEELFDFSSENDLINWLDSH